MGARMPTKKTDPALPAALTKEKAQKLKTGARKAMPGGVHSLLLKLEIPQAAWPEALAWLIREQGDELGHQWQCVCDFVNVLEERASLPIDDAVSVVERLGEKLAYRGKELALHNAPVLLPGWHWALDKLVIRSFHGHLDRLRAATVHESYRLGVLYARAQLGDSLAAEEKAEVLAALATAYVTVEGQLTALVVSDGELVEYPDISFQNDDVDEDWTAVRRPVAGDEAWARAIGAAAAANERIESRWERPTLHVARVLRHARACTPEQLALTIAFGHVDEDACGADREALAKAHLGGLDATTQAALLKTLRELAETTERELPDEVVLSLGGEVERD
jgi:hypothetical protein